MFRIQESSQPQLMTIPSSEKSGLPGLMDPQRNVQLIMSKTRGSSLLDIAEDADSVVVVVLYPSTPHSLPVISLTSSMAMSPNCDLASVAVNTTWKSSCILSMVIVCSSQCVPCEPVISNLLELEKNKLSVYKSSFVYNFLEETKLSCLHTST